jgi:hypothetical protein
MDKIFIGSLPGCFEQDEDSPNKMICLGKKSYQYGSDIKFKGIPAKRLTEENIQSMRFDFDVNVSYTSPTAWKTAMKNHVERPNEFLPKSRRVARGKSLSELGMLHDRAKLFSVKESKEFLDSILTIV